MWRVQTIFSTYIRAKMVRLRPDEAVVSYFELNAERRAGLKQSPTLQVVRFGWFKIHHTLCDFEMARDVGRGGGGVGGPYHGYDGLLKTDKVKVASTIYMQGGAKMLGENACLPAMPAMHAMPAILCPVQVR